jgi:hypothetical protein
LLCPCPVDAPPTSDDGQRHGVGVFSIADGNLDDTDLSGVNLCLVNLFPSNLTSGNWKLGIVVDEGLLKNRRTHSSASSRARRAASSSSSRPSPTSGSGWSAVR